MKVLLINGTEDVFRNVSFSLQLRWPDCRVATHVNGFDGPELVKTESPELVIVDVSSTETDGLRFVERIRAVSEIPIIMLVNKESQTLMVAGLEIGADDYVIKPVNPVELLAKVVALLRRIQGTGNRRNQEALTLGSLMLNLTTREVSIQGERVRLTPIEYSLLTHLARNEGKVLTHSTLLEKVWGPDFDDPSFVKKYIYRLRSKLGDDARDPRILLSERGVGYRFIRPIDDVAG
ncbi:MAG: response regulator transcription factor [Dehalococcoidia bacterium]|nr:response regulator transcription factor [Dehalococcoidia bacterium]